MGRGDKGEGATERNERNGHSLASILLKWFGPITTILAFFVGGVVAYTKAQAAIADVGQRVAVVEKDGSGTAREAVRKAADAEKRVEKVEDALGKLAETLDRVDRRVALMACKQDRRECR